MRNLPTIENPIYQYVRDENNRPIGVVAGAFHGLMPLLGYSLCGPRDRWDRNLGKRIALGRLDIFDLTSETLENLFPTHIVPHLIGEEIIKVQDEKLSVSKAKLVLAKMNERLKLFVEEIPE